MNLDDVLGLARFAGLGHVLPVSSPHIFRQLGMRFTGEQFPECHAQPKTSQSSHRQEVSTIGIKGVIGAPAKLITGWFLHKFK